MSIENNIIPLQVDIDAATNFLNTLYNGGYIYCKEENRTKLSDYVSDAFADHRVNNMSWGEVRAYDENVKLRQEIEQLKSKIAPPEENICHSDAAKKLVAGDRNKTYGDPPDVFGSYAASFTSVLWKKLKEPVSAVEAGLCLVGLKLARHGFKAQDDNLKDGHGYLNCVECIEKNVKPQQLFNEFNKIEYTEFASKKDEMV